MATTGIGEPASQAMTRQVDLLRALIDANTAREVASAIVSWLQTEPACTSARVSWGFHGARQPESEPAAQVPDEVWKWARAVTRKAGPPWLIEGDVLALRVSDAPVGVLLLEFKAGVDSRRFIDERGAWLAIAGNHLARVLEAADLGGSLLRLQRSEVLQRALFAISDLAGSDGEMPDLLRGLHEIVGTLMYAENFFIVLRDSERDSLRFPYYVDTADPRAPGDHNEIPMATLERSVTWYLLRDAKPLMGTTQNLVSQVSGPLALMGPEGCDWLGVPMLRDGRARGAIVVQSYREDMRYTADDRTLLEFVADHILTALERKQGKEDLERRVRLRTVELAQANQGLQQEIVERQRAERLQKALFHVAQLAMVDITQAEFYRQVHAEVAGLMNADNFFIGLLSDDGAWLEFPYYVDGTPCPQPSRLLGRGLSEYVIRLRQPLCGTIEDILALAAHGEIELQTAGAPAVCWLGVPLLADDRAIGLIVVQSYAAAVMYGAPDQELLSFVASQVANSLQRRRSAQMLMLAYEQLEQRVQERTRDLTRTLDQLRETRDELVQQEKLASLGGLVAGIAHEINTPLGIGMTATSHVQSESRYWRERIAAGAFGMPECGVMIDELEVTVRVLEGNVRRGAELVRSFKQIAVDQSSGQQRSFELAEYLDEIVLSLKPRLKHMPWALQVQCPVGIEMNSFPGALSQVVTNLIMNALLHAFAGRESGTISVHGQADGDDVLLQVSDDGIGMVEADLRRIFDPFFTTKRGAGGTGLGAHIVFNQVTNVLGGTIRVASTPGTGLQVQIRIPRVLESKA